jgi:chromosome segregation ATPase
MSLLLSPETYERLEKKFGKQEAREISEALDAVKQDAQKAIENVQQKADFLIAQKKFELKDELTKELATKADVVKLEGEIQTVRQEIQTLRQEIQTVRQEIQTAKVELDRKFTIMFLILLFTTIFLNVIVK